MTEKQGFSLKQIQQMYRMDLRYKSKQTLFNSEEKGEIPKAMRVPRGSGKIEERRWLTNQLPQIGKRFGFLEAQLKYPEIISVFTQKGGTLKSTFTYSFSRILALNGIRVLMIGLDTQGSLTNVALGSQTPDSLEEFRKLRDEWGGLYHLLFQKDVTIDDVIQKTDLPTLDVIPETGELAELERRLQGSDGRESVFKKKLLPQIKGYDVVIFDNSPSWNQLVKNSLFCASTVISPIGCDLGTFEVIDTNMKTVREFQENLGIHWRNFIMVPTLLEKTKLSQQIYGAYISTYGDNVLPSPIRRGVLAQEASFCRQSVLEYDPTSALAGDYYDLINGIWSKLIGGQKELAN